MQNKNHLFYYLTVAGIFILLKYAFRFADNDDLAFLLAPTDKLVGFLTGSQSVYIAENGYYHAGLNILIDKSCSGFNYWMICFLMLTFLALRFSDKHLRKILSIPIAFVSAFILTILVNASRIFVSIIVQPQANYLLPGKQHFIHETIGIVTNLSFLILIYYLIEKQLIKKQGHAKFA